MSPSTVVARTMARNGRLFLSIVLTIQVLGVVLVAIGNGVLADHLTESVWEFPGVVWIRYPLFGVGAAFGATTLSMYVANGITRRDYLGGIAKYSAFVCVLVAIVGVIGYGLERGVYVVGGWDADLDSLSPARLFATYVLLYVAYLVNGTLIGASFARWKQRTAAWMITPLLFPLAAAEVLLGTWWGGLSNDAANDPWLPFGAAVPLTVLAIAAGAWLAFLLLRDVPIKPKKG